MQLSRFFTLAEMTRSDTAMRHGIANQPDAPAAANLTALCTQVLDPLRDAIQSSITVNSGYRGPELNAKIGGARKSQHMEGKAADIQSSKVSVLDLFKTVVRLGLPYDQVIFEAKNRNTKWVHVSHDPSRSRGEIMVAQFSADGSSVRYRAISVQEALDLADPMPVSRSGATPELAFEELHDEPGFEDTAVEEKAPAAPKAAVRRRAKKRPKVKAAPKRKAASKRKAAPKRKPRRKTAAKPVRKKAKKHK